MFSFQSLSINKPEARHVFSSGESKLKVTEITVNQTIIPICLPLKHHISKYGLTITTNKKAFVKKIPILKNGEWILVGVRFMVECSVISGLLCEIRLQITFKNDRLKKYITATSATVATPSESLHVYMRDGQLAAKMRCRSLMSLMKNDSHYRQSLIFPPKLFEDTREEEKKNKHNKKSNKPAILA